MNRKYVFILGIAAAAAAVLFWAFSDEERYTEHDAYLDSAGRPAVLVCHWEHDKMAQPPMFAIRPDAQGIIPTQGPSFAQLGVTTPPMTQQFSKKTADALKIPSSTPTVTPTVIPTTTPSVIPSLIPTVTPTMMIPMTTTAPATTLPPLTVPPSVPITTAPV